MFYLFLSKVLLFFEYFNNSDVHPLLAQYLPETTYSCDYVQSIPSTNTTIILPNWTCNDLNYTIFDFSRFTELEHLEIGNNSFKSVETFIIDGLNNLTTLIIGKNSFTFSKTYFGWTPAKLFHIKNCESLISIDIDAFSFSDYTGKFELTNCPALQSIKIGRIGDIYDDMNWLYDFYYISFVVRGIYKLELIFK